MKQALTTPHGSKNDSPSFTDPGFCSRFAAVTMAIVLGCGTAAFAGEIPRGDSIAQRLQAMAPPEVGLGKAPVKDELTAIKLATFALSNGNEISIQAVPEIGELGYVEIVAAGGGSILTDDKLSPLEVFLALAPAEAPVPNALIELDLRGDAEKLTAGRERTDRILDPLHVSVAELGLSHDGAAKATNSCSSGGGNYFANNYCGLPVPVFNHLGGILFCDANYNGGDSLWFNLTRNSYSGGWKKRYRSYGRTAACGTSVRIRQQYWWDGAWVNLSTQNMLSGQIYISAWQGPFAYRRILRNRLTGSGGFRAFTDFYNYIIPVP